MDYNVANFSKALTDAGIKPGDTVFSHSNIGFFGLPEGEKSIENACQTIWNAFLEVLGNEGTLIVPTFTYSFSQGKSFDPENTPSDCGIFTEYIRSLPNSVRSQDPNVSVTAIGKNAEVITQNISTNSYSRNSVFGRFLDFDVKICNLNFDAGSTYIHFVERELKVPYRFDKNFSGKLIENGNKLEHESTIFVRHLSKETIPNFDKFTELALNKERFKLLSVGRGTIGVISARDTFELIKKNIIDNPELLINGEN